MDNKQKLPLCGIAAGTVNGLFGGGGGMVLVPMLTGWCRLEQKRALANSVAVIFPICIISAGIYLFRTKLDLMIALPYLVGGLVGGFIGGRLFPSVPSVWLRRIFAAFLLYGGVRYLL
ncbi:MAG: sulfite exporter TauE/SafE family protein [Clostridiales bacterium]|nr:sulfite exporter TauE/SafE family protein [Candidatus Cacconaster stercorequi]